MNSLEALQAILVFPKNSEEYKKACPQMLQCKQEDLDEKIIEYISKLLNIDDVEDLEFPLSAQQLHKLPNLYSDDPNSFEYTKLTELLLELAGRKAFTSAVNDHLYSVISQTDSVCNHITFTAILLLLQSAYGIDGAQIPVDTRQTVNDKIKNFLCNPVESGDDLSHELLVPLATLKKLLHHTRKEVRLQARAVCEDLHLPLDLPHMLSCSIDGVQSDGKEAENGVLVIGNTGAGKSTLINILSGIEHEMKCELYDTDDITLHPKPGQEQAPARVGHSLTSKTLCPQVINSGELSYYDCPGFADNRYGDEAICSALGIPLVMKHAKHIRAIIVVIDWKATTNKGEAVRSLIQILSKIIQDPLTLASQDKPGNPIPLLFAISKPPLQHGRYFQPNILRKKFITNIIKIEQSRATAFHTNEMNKQKRNQLIQDCNNLGTCLKIVTNFMAEKEDLENHFSCCYRELKNIIGLKGQDAISIKNQIIDKFGDKLKADGCSEVCIVKLKELFHGIRDCMQEDKRNDYVNKQKKQWEKDKEKNEKDIKELQKLIKPLNDEQAMFNVIKESSNNIFIIRGYQSDCPQDEPDHKELLLAYLKSLCEKQIEIPKSNFVFNPHDKEYTAVRLWAESLASDVELCFKGLQEIPDDITELERKIQQQQKKISRCKKELSSKINVSEELKPDEETKLIEEIVKGYQEKIDALKKEESILHGKLKNLEDAICKIEQAAPVEYASCLRSEEDLWFAGRLSSNSSEWEYIFPGTYFSYYHYDSATIWDKIKLLFTSQGKKEIIPIHHVELSYFTTVRYFSFDETKVIFKHEIANDFAQKEYNFHEKAICDPDVKVVKIHGNNNSNEDEGIFIVEAFNKYTNTGYFNIDVNETQLDQGKLKVTYVSNNGNAGYAGVRVFVLPKYLPDERKKIHYKEKEKEKFNTLIKGVQCKIEYNNTVIKKNEAYLSLLQRGLGKDQSVKINRIIQLLQQIGYTEQEFIDDFFDSPTRKHVTWLGEEKNYKSLKTFTDTYHQKMLELSDIDDKVYAKVMGVQLTVLQFSSKKKEVPLSAKSGVDVSQTKTNEESEKDHADFVKSMQLIAVKTGFNIDALYDILKALRTSFEELQQSLNYELRQLELEKMAYQYYCQKLSERYNKFLLQLRVLDVIIELFRFPEGSSTEKYSSMHQLLKEKKRATEHLYSTQINIENNSSLQRFIKNPNNAPVPVSYGLAIDYLVPPGLMLSNTNSNVTVAQTAQPDMLPGYTRYTTAAANNPAVSSNNVNIDNSHNGRPMVGI